MLIGPRVRRRRVEAAVLVMFAVTVVLVIVAWLFVLAALILVL